MTKFTLKALRVNVGLTQDEVALILGISKSTLVQWEKGRTFPNPVQINKICELYETNYDNIIFLQDKNA